jgi:hypothetical protein
MSNKQSGVIEVKEGIGGNVVEVASYLVAKGVK